MISAAHDRLPADSATSSFLYFVLNLCSMIYGIGRAAVECLYRFGVLQTLGLPLPVISVGNVTWGGTGKTPLTMLIARLLAERRHRAAVLTRGYGGDEDKMMAYRLDGIALVGSGADRYRAAQSILAVHGHAR